MKTDHVADFKSAAKKEHMVLHCFSMLVNGGWLVLRVKRKGGA